MEDLFVFLISFTFIFLVYLVIYFIKLFKKELPNIKEYELLCAKFKIEKDKINYKGVSIIIYLINTFIISFTGTVCTMFDLKYIWQMAIGFVMLMALIIIFYTLLGKILEKKYKKEGK